MASQQEPSNPLRTILIDNFSPYLSFSVCSGDSDHNSACAGFTVVNVNALEVGEVLF